MLPAGGWGVAATDAMLYNMLLRRVPHDVPALDGHAVLAVGAAGIKDTFPGDILEGVRLAYLDGLHAGRALLGTAAFGMTCLWALLPKRPGRFISPSGTQGSRHTAGAIA